MEIILKHLDGVQQYRLLNKLLQDVIDDPDELVKKIQEIMNDVNKK